MDDQIPRKVYVAAAKVDGDLHVIATTTTVAGAEDRAQDWMDAHQHRFADYDSRWTDSPSGANDYDRRVQRRWRFGQGEFVEITAEFLEIT
jgi:hypothetical protein